MAALQRKTVLLVLVLWFRWPGCDGFTGLHPPVVKPASRTRLSRLYESAVEVKFPNQEEAVSLGARDWPQQLKSGSWTEQIDSGKTAARYVLDGTGTVDVILLQEDGSPKVSEPTPHKLVAGSLIEAVGPAKLSWQVDDEMIVLTPGYEQANLFAAVGSLFIVLCGVLLSGVGQ